MTGFLPVLGQWKNCRDDNVIDTMGRALGLPTNWSLASAQPLYRGELIIARIRVRFPNCLRNRFNGVQSPNLHEPVHSTDRESPRAR